MRRKIPLSLLAASPLLLFAFSGMTPPGYTGDPVDNNGADCSSCHNTFGPANSDPTGKVTLIVADYVPGVQQPLRVIVSHPTATRWGFQITARSVNDPVNAAGTFTATQDVAVYCTNGAVAPCNGPAEFAEQVAAPRTTVTGSEEFDLVWTPPTSEVGRIVLYVSAVAADGNNAPSNDRVYTTSSTISLSNTASCSASQRPALRTAMNAASFQPSFSSLSMLSVFGTGFAASGLTRSAGPGDFIGNAFPTVLACVSVQINGKTAPVSYVSPTQINVQVPDLGGATGPVSMTVALNAGKPNELRSDVATLTNVQGYAPAFFTFNSSGTGSIAAQFSNTAIPVANTSVVAGGRPAKPGDYITLYATGLGATIPGVPAGGIDQGVSVVSAPVTVSIGGVTLPSGDVLYAGLSPGSIGGLYQINVRVPLSATNGDLPVTLQVGGLSTQSGATIPVQQ